ncbi:MAG: type II secretion system protein GspM [Gallionellaceae bacterium]|nr:type II secretion system protein GspM [Gallionellaceae bacterium]
MVAKIDGMSLRERTLIFAAAAFLLVSVINSFFLDPLLAKQKKLSLQVVQQQEKMKEIQSQMEALMQAKKDDASSPLRERLKLIKEQIAEGETYLKNRRDKLVPPEKMGDLLEQVLSKNGRLQLVGLETLAVAPLIEPLATKAALGATATKPIAQDKQVFKHGVKITVRGSYSDLLQYLTELERLPTQMFWGSIKLNVVQHPSAELTITLYTLSLDTTWLQV